MKRVTVNQVCKLNISELIEQGYLLRGQKKSGYIIWDDGSALYYEGSLAESAKYLRLSYSFEGETYNYSIVISAVPSNLGKGVYYLFNCPATGKPVKILYRCYDSPFFQSMAAYNTRIYYPYQLAPKNRQYQERSRAAASKKEALTDGKRAALLYAGKVTTRAVRSFVYTRKATAYSTINLIAEAQRIGIAA